MAGVIVRMLRPTLPGMLAGVILCFLAVLSNMRNVRSTAYNRAGLRLAPRAEERTWHTSWPKTLWCLVATRPTEITPHTSKDRHAIYSVNATPNPPHHALARRRMACFAPRQNSNPSRRLTPPPSTRPLCPYNSEEGVAVKGRARAEFRLSKALTSAIKTLSANKEARLSVDCIDGDRDLA